MDNMALDPGPVSPVAPNVDRAALFVGTAERGHPDVLSVRQGPIRLRGTTDLWLRAHPCDLHAPEVAEVVSPTPSDTRPDGASGHQQALAGSAQERNPRRSTAPTRFTRHLFPTIPTTETQR